MRPISVRQIPFHGLLICFVAAAAAAGFARGEADPGWFRERIQQNHERLKQYGWTSTILVTVNGEEKRRSTHLVRYDRDGTLQKSPVGSDRGKKKDQKKMQEPGDGPRERVEPYIHPVTGAWQRFFGIATAWEGRGPRSGSIQIEADSYRIEEDHMKIRLDSETGRPRTMPISAYLEGYPVSVETEFRAIFEGPAYPARTVIRIPARQMEITIENFDHIEQGH